MRQDLVAIGRPTPKQGHGAGRPQAGITWRHVATLLLLMVVVPVLLVAGAAAIAVLPVVLAVVGIEHARQLARSMRQATPIRTRR